MGGGGGDTTNKSQGCHFCVKKLYQPFFFFFFCQKDFSGLRSGPDCTVFGPGVLSTRDYSTV